MKSRLTITIKKQLIMKIKRYAASRKTTVSKIAEEHFVKLTKGSSQKGLRKTKNSSKKGGLIELIESLPRPKLPKGDLVKLYYERKGKEYGL